MALTAAAAALAATAAGVHEDQEPRGIQQPTFVASARTAFVTTACHCAVSKVKEHQLAPLTTRGGRTNIVWSPISEFGLL